MSDVSLAFWDCFHCILPRWKSNSPAPTRTIGAKKLISTICVPDGPAGSQVSRRVAVAVGVEAQKAGLTETTSLDELERNVGETMWRPHYALLRRTAS